MESKYENKIKKIIIILLDIAFVSALVVCFITGFNYLKDKENIEVSVKARDELKNEVITVAPKDKSDGTTKDSYKINWDKLVSVNPNIVGWIKIDGTNIDYPVLCTANNNTYLTHDFRGYYSSFGSIFADCSLYGKDIGKEDKYLLYGHNMGSNQTIMFSQLKEYLSEDFYKEHKEIFVYTKNGTYKYSIVSVMRLSPRDEIYDLKKENMEKWFEKINEQSLYRCKIEKGKNKALILSTCTNDGKERIVVVGRMIKN